MNPSSYLARLEDTLRSRSEIIIRTIGTRQELQRGFFRAELEFMDGSLLFVVENGIQMVQGQVQRDQFVFHYQRSDGTLIFRYDNSPHFPELPTFPAHKHTPDRVVPAEPPDLADVLREIDTFLYPNP